MTLKTDNPSRACGQRPKTPVDDSQYYAIIVNQPETQECQPPAFISVSPSRSHARRTWGRPQASLKLASLHVCPAVGVQGALESKL
jgi:hypothetical protein